MSMNDGRTIRYYDPKPVVRTSADPRPKEDSAGIGEMRLDPLLNEWVAVVAHRQNRAFLPPKELCPLCPTKGDLLTEIPESQFNVVVFDNKNPSLNTPKGEWSLPELNGVDTPITQGAGKCEVIVYSDRHEGNFGALTLEHMALVCLLYTSDAADE